MNSQARIPFWLLVAATIAVDAVSFAWYHRAGPQSLLSYLIQALTTGQLAVVCLWATFGARRSWVALLSVLIAVLVCTAVDLWGAWFSAGESFGMSAMVAIAFMVALWILKRSSFWRGVADDQIAAWQFSVAQILVAMTVCALLITALRRSELMQDVELWKFLVAHTMCDVAVVLITTILWAKLQTWPFRLAAVLAAALIAGALLTTADAIGMAGTYVGDSFKDLVPNTAYTILISLIVLIWLEFAPIVPIRRRTKSISSAGDLE